MMSGIPETVITRPISADSATVTASTSSDISRHVVSGWSSINRAAMQLASTIIAPTDRSMPPEITTIAWAIARNASGRVAAVMVRTSKPPNCGTWLTRQNSSTTRSRATPTSQP